MKKILWVYEGNHSMEVIMNVEFSEKEYMAISAAMKFIIKHFYKDDLDDEVYLMMTDIRSKILNAKQE